MQRGSSSWAITRIVQLEGREYTKCCTMITLHVFYEIIYGMSQYRSLFLLSGIENLVNSCRYLFKG